MSLPPLNGADRTALEDAIALAEDVIHQARLALGHTSQPGWGIDTRSHPTSAADRKRIVREVKDARSKLANGAIEKRLGPWRQRLRFKNDYESAKQNIKLLLELFRTRLKHDRGIDADEIARLTIESRQQLFSDAQPLGGAKNRRAVTAWLFNTVNGGKPASAALALECEARRYGLSQKQARDLLGDGKRAWKGLQPRRNRRTITPR